MSETGKRENRRWLPKEPFQIAAIAQGQRSRIVKKSVTHPSARSMVPSLNVIAMPDAVDAMATMSAIGRFLPPMAMSDPSMDNVLDAMCIHPTFGFK